MKLVDTYEAYNSIDSAPAPAKRIGVKGFWPVLAWGKLYYRPDHRDPERVEQYGWFVAVGRFSLRKYTI